MGAEPSATSNPVEPSPFCLEQLDKFSSLKAPPGSQTIKELCPQAQVMDSCRSVEEKPIFHFNFPSNNPDKKNILVFSLIHGDELGAGQVIKYWTERLSGIKNPRNEWRIIPILNPDGLKKKSRLNSKGVDLNRNFPTKDWNDEAHSLWAKLGNNPRRYPGPQASSEPETLCALKHIEEFKPFFISSIHTPLAVLDFDGPELKKKPPFSYLPWRSLGHFPGSLGRYMWFERQVPVLTAEFLSEGPKERSPLDQLQDGIGSLVQWL